MALMIESIMYLGIGFLAASISVLAVVPIVHTRAVRLTTRQLADTMPSSVAEIAADKDLLRAEFAMSTRTLEMKVDQLKGKGANHLLELGKSSNTVNHLRIELDALRERLHTTDEQLASESAALKVAEHALADRASELATLMCDLEQQSILSDGQKIEIVTLKTQVEALKVRLEANNNELQAVYKCRDAEQIEFEARVDALTIAAQKAEATLADREAELAKLSDDFNAQTMLSETQTARIVTLDGEIETLRKRLDTANSELKTGEDHRSELTAAIKTAELALSEKDLDASQLVGELSERAAFAYAQANEIFTLKGEVDALTGRLDETHKALRAAEDRGHELSAAVENAERVLSKRESEVTRLTSELDARAMLGQAQTNEIFVIKAEVDTLAGRLNEACAALNAAEDRGQAFAAAAGHAEQALLAKESEIARLIAELDERSTLSEAQASEIRSLEAEVESITGRLDETSQALNTADDGRDALTVAVEKAERTLSAKESDFARLAGELNEHSTLSEAQANEILGLKAEVESLTARFDETSKALNTAEDQRHALTSAAEKAEWALSAKESEVARLIGELNVHSTLSEAQTSEIVSLTAEVETLTARLDEAGKALSAAKDGHYALIAAAENAERSLSAKESELARFSGELNARSTRSEAQTNEMLGLKAEVRTLTGRLDEACNALTAAEDHRYALTVAAENAERALSEKEADLARLTGELNERSTFADIQAKELVALKAYVGAIKERLDAADNELQAVEDRRAAERLELDAAIQGVMGERARFVSFHGRVAELVEQLVEQTSEDKNLARRARDLENRLAEQSRLLEASDCERKQLRKEIDAALKTEAERRNAVITEIDNHAKAENAKLRAALDRANGDRTRLAYELATAKRQAQLLKAGEQQDGIVAA
jgi:chromosome segregation ATPase